MGPHSARYTEVTSVVGVTKPFDLKRLKVWLVTARHPRDHSDALEGRRQGNMSCGHFPSHKMEAPEANELE